MKFPADLVTFTEEILNGKLYFLCSESFALFFQRKFFAPILFPRNCQKSSYLKEFFQSVCSK